MRGLRPARRRILASSSCSLSGAQSSGADWRIERGTVSSTSASSEGAPTALSISSISAGDGPIWRRLAKS